jgi:hypothetical protein
MSNTPWLVFRQQYEAAVVATWTRLDKAIWRNIADDLGDLPGDGARGGGVGLARGEVSGVVCDAESPLGRLGRKLLGKGLRALAFAR